MVKMMSKPKLVTIRESGYTKEEVQTLGSYICDGVWDSYLTGEFVDPLTAAKLVSTFATTKEAWEEGRKDLKEMGKFIADAALHEFVNVRKGIFK